MEIDLLSSVSEQEREVKARKQLQYTKTVDAEVVQ